MSLANIFLCVALAVGALSFIYFARVVIREPDQRALLVGSKPGEYFNFIVTIPLVVLLVVGSYHVRVAAAVCLVVVMAFLAAYQHRWLVARGAKRTFLNGLLVSSLGFVLAIASFAGSMVFGV